MCRQHHQIGAMMPHNLKHYGAWIAQTRNRLHMESRKSLLGKCPQAALLVIVRLVFEVGVRVGQFPIGEEIRSIGMHQRHCGREPIRNFPDVGNNGPAGIGIVDREQDLAKRQHDALRAFLWPNQLPRAYASVHVWGERGIAGGPNRTSKKNGERRTPQSMNKQRVHRFRSFNRSFNCRLLHSLTHFSPFV